MKKIFLTTVALIALCISTSAFTLQEVSVYSKSMNKDVSVSLITPDCYDEKSEFPVIYLLHGFSDNHQRWPNNEIV